MKNVFVVLLSLCSIAVLPRDAFSEEVYVEPGRFGVEWAVTEDTVFMGGVYKGDKLDAALFFSGHQFTDGATNSWVVNARVGYRWNLGSQNYLATGILANVTVAGTDYGTGISPSFNDTKQANSQGINIAGSGREGPYIAIQRHFAHSGVFLELAVMPYAYQTSIINNSGTRDVVHDNRFMESGYVGIGYLFGASGDDAKGRAE